MLKTQVCLLKRTAPEQPHNTQSPDHFRPDRSKPDRSRPMLTISRLAYSRPDHSRSFQASPGNSNGCPPELGGQYPDIRRGPVCPKRVSARVRLPGSRGPSVANLCTPKECPPELGCQNPEVRPSRACVPQNCVPPELACQDPEVRQSLACVPQKGVRQS